MEKEILAKPGDTIINNNPKYLYAYKVLSENWTWKYIHTEESIKRHNDYMEAMYQIRLEEEQFFKENRGKIAGELCKATGAFGLGLLVMFSPFIIFALLVLYGLINVLAA